MAESRLLNKYQTKVKGELMSRFNIKNSLAVPYIKKVVVNVGIGSVAKNKENLEALKKDLSIVTGQFPSTRPAKISVAGFSVRRGMPVGLTITLRRDKMYSFLDRLISIVLPRLRDFRGVNDKGIDSSGSFTIGFSEHTVFPEIDAAKSAQPHGFEVTIVMGSSNPEKTKVFLELMGMPFIKPEKV